MIDFSILPKKIKRDYIPSHIVHPQYGLLVFDERSRMYSGVVSLEMYKEFKEIYTIPEFSINLEP